jgi:hypothetical protein
MPKTIHVPNYCWLSVVRKRLRLYTDHAIIFCIAVQKVREQSIIAAHARADCMTDSEVIGDALARFPKCVLPMR